MAVCSTLWLFVVLAGGGGGGGGCVCVNIGCVKRGCIGRVRNVTTPVCGLLI